MTRRDRAAIVLALTVAREAVWRDEVGSAVGALIMAGGDVGRRGGALIEYVNGPIEGVRMFRARLALFLRALLRADAGDFGRWRGCGECRLCALDHGGSAWANVWQRICDQGTRRITPLWQQAPRTGTTTRPAGLNRR